MVCGRCGQIGVADVESDVYDNGRWRVRAQWLISETNVIIDNDRRAQPWFLLTVSAQDPSTPNILQTAVAYTERGVLVSLK